eukprot:scaffold117978_cov27-Tisochrysis_lutea.AAC.1
MGLIVGREEDVGRLDVAVKDPAGVYVLERARQLGQPAHHCTRRKVHPARAACGDHVGECAAWRVLHHNRQHIVLDKRVDVRDNVAVMERLQDSHLVLQLDGLRSRARIERDLLRYDAFAACRSSQEHCTAMLSTAEDTEAL